jgi:preprotein translocase subunit SecF
MIIKNRSKICLIISAAIFVVALVLTLCGRGINMGIDFEGGLSMQYDLKTAAEKTDIESVLNGMGVGSYTITVQGAGNNEVNIRIKDVAKDDIQKVQADFETGVKEKYPDAVSVGDVNYVGPVAGATLVKNAIVSVLLAAVLMLIYIAIRFDLNSGLSAVFGLLHDVLMMLSFMVIFRSVIQMNSSFIAAALTIVGYSINNTIVIFDRIRENHKKMPNAPKEEVTNRSIKESLGRTVCTTLTTLITIVALCILGVASIREFALPIIVGILSGVYSANMINGYVWAFLEEKRASRKAKGKKA